VLPRTFCLYVCLSVTKGRDRLVVSVTCRGCFRSRVVIVVVIVMIVVVWVWRFGRERVELAIGGAPNSVYCHSGKPKSDESKRPGKDLRDANFVHDENLSSIRSVRPAATDELEGETDRQATT
jgi:hypothetical protein